MYNLIYMSLSDSQESDSEGRLFIDDITIEEFEMKMQEKELKKVSEDLQAQANRPSPWGATRRQEKRMKFIQNSLGLRENFDLSKDDFSPKGPRIPKVS